MKERREGGREGGRKEGREGGRKGRKKEGREGGRYEGEGEREEERGINSLPSRFKREREEDAILIIPGW